MHGRTAIFLAALALVGAAVIASAHEIRIPYDRLPAQIELDEAVGDPTYKAILFSGGFGSGKSHGNCMSLLKLSAINYPTAGALVTPDFATYGKKAIWPQLMQILADAGIAFEHKKADNILELRWHPRQDPQPVYLTSAEDPHRLKAMNLGWATVDEPGLMKEDAYLFLLSRLRDTRAPIRQVVLTGTPEDIYRAPWLLHRFIDVDSRDAGTLVIYASTKDAVEAGTVPLDWYEMMLASYPAKMREAYLEGRFVAINAGNVYWSFEQSRHCRKGLRRNPDVPMYVFLDFNVDPMAGTLANPVSPRGITCFDEIFLRNSNTRAWCRELKRRYPPEVQTAGVTVFADATGMRRDTRSTTTDLKILQEELSLPNGYRLFSMRVPTANPEEWDRVVMVNNAFEKGWITIDSERCPHLVKDLVLTPKKEGENRIDKTKDHELTHPSDGLGYGIVQLAPGWGAADSGGIKLGDARRRMADYSFVPGRRS